tara:strand:- start:108715 stop:109287 length:573 start_codon:yes stop_codon:yes gene_type:complete
MDEEIDRLVVSVRADTQGFAKDISDMRAGLEGPLAAGADRAGRAIERGLMRAVRTGKFGFEDLRRIALSALNAIAQDALKVGLGSLGGAGGGGGILGGVLSIAGAALGGSPGRATGGPVSAGRAYRVGESGPELFVPGASGRIIAAGGGGAGGRDVRVTINVNAPDAGAPQALARSARQIARNVRSALSE